MGEGPTKLIFLHGWGGSTDSFWLLGLALCETLKDTEIILLDYPGFGQTDFPPKKGFSTFDYGHWVLDFMKDIKVKKAHFYVHSNGGRILVRMLQKNPKIAEKCIFTGAAGIKWPLSLRQRISVGLSKIIPKPKKGLGQKVHKFFTTKVFGARDWGQVDPKLKTTLTKILKEPDFREDLTQIKNESLLMWGAHDGMSPLKSALVWDTKMPNSTLKVFPDGRHGIHHTHRKEIVKLVTKFLR